ncbi:hypothetical protein [Ravibacter arvi]|uniref:hypothetical protein n=1 Tax=Ravibacter arvi TaxID=2051041 RepID=UPI0031E58632
MTVRTARPSVVLSIVAHLPDGHPERNVVEPKDLLLLEKSYLKDWVRGPGDPSAALGMTVRSARPSLVLSIIAHLPEGHPERNVVEPKDLLLLEKSYLKDWVRGPGDPSAAVGMTLRGERRQTCCGQW